MVGSSWSSCTYKKINKQKNEQRAAAAAAGATARGVVQRQGICRPPYKCRRSICFATIQPHAASVCHVEFYRNNLYKIHRTFSRISAKKKGILWSIALQHSTTLHRTWAMKGSMIINLRPPEPHQAYGQDKTNWSKLNFKQLPCVSCNFFVCVLTILNFESNNTRSALNEIQIIF